MGFQSRLPALDPNDRRLNAGRATVLRQAHVIAPTCDLRREPRPDCGIDTQLLCGAAVRVFEEENGWALVQADNDGYVGWTSAVALHGAPFAPTHVVSAPRTFVYPGPDLRFPSLRALSMGSRLEISGEAVTRGTRYLLTPGGEALIANHLHELGEHEMDYVEVARRLLGSPYLWGGNSAFGIDCSGLVQLAMQMCGRKVLRDSDMQAATLGTEIDPGPNFDALQRGDLVFWRGHVAMVEGDGHILHASGHTMLVTSEPLMSAISRIASLYEEPIGFRRP
jgi:cell wall-associated NlpC family hydrolase